MRDSLTFPREQWELKLWRGENQRPVAGWSGTGELSQKRTQTSGFVMEDTRFSNPGSFYEVPDKGSVLSTTYEARISRLRRQAAFSMYIAESARATRSFIPSPGWLPASPTDASTRNFIAPDLNWTV